MHAVKSTPKLASSPASWPSFRRRMITCARSAGGGSLQWNVWMEFRNSHSGVRPVLMEGVWKTILLSQYSYPSNPSTFETSRPFSVIVLHQVTHRARYFNVLTRCKRKRWKHRFDLCIPNVASWSPLWQHCNLLLLLASYVFISKRKNALILRSQKI